MPDQPGIDIDLFGRMKAALFGVITDQCSKNVGDFVVPAAIDFGRWNFYDYCDVISHEMNLMELLPQDGTWHPVRFGTRQEGGYAFNFMSSNAGSDTATALYFQQGEFGVVFRTEDGGFPKARVVAPPISPLDFEDKLALDYNMEVKSMFSGANEYARRGWNRFHRGKHAAALFDLNKAVNLEPNDAKVRLARGLILMQMDDLTMAEVDLNRAIEVDPLFVGALQARGVMNARRGELQAALRDFDKALEIDPGNAEALANRERARRDARSL